MRVGHRRLGPVVLVWIVKIVANYRIVDLVINANLLEVLPDLSRRLNLVYSKPEQKVKVLAIIILFLLVKSVQVVLPLVKQVVGLAAELFVYVAQLAAGAAASKFVDVVDVETLLKLDYFLLHFGFWGILSRISDFRVALHHLNGYLAGLAPRFFV